MNDEQQPKKVFEAYAHEAFDFLCLNSSLRCVASKSNLVRFESPTVFFEVGYTASYDCEVYARIGRLGAPGVLSNSLEERLDFGLFLSVADPDGYIEFRRIVPNNIATSEGQIRRVLSYFSIGLGQYGIPLLSADDKTYAHARELRFWHAPDFPADALSN